MWNCGKKPLLSASIAEAEIIAMADGFTGSVIEAIYRCHKQVSTHAVIYTDNSAALQLCSLDAGSWRTRHLRLKGNMIRQAVERGEWCAAHLDGVHMPADIGTKPLRPSRFENLVHLVGLKCPHLHKVAALKTGVARILLALTHPVEPSYPVSAQSISEVMNHDWAAWSGNRSGRSTWFRGYIRWSGARAIHRAIVDWEWVKTPVHTVKLHRFKVHLAEPATNLSFRRKTVRFQVPCLPSQQRTRLQVSPRRKAVRCRARSKSSKCHLPSKRRTRLQVSPTRKDVRFQAPLRFE